MKNQKKDLFDSDSRKVRDSISSIFFDIYETVFKKTLTHLDDNSEAYRCFLTTCHIDKDLLTPEQDRELNSLVTTPLGASKEGIYTLNEWLEKIYTSEKDPSVNEFGQDYFEVFREKKKRGEVTEKDRISYEGDRDARLKHEIENLFKLGQRLCYGQMHGYLPILHSGMISSSLQQALVTPEKLAKSLRKILDVDYSAFHREIVYSNSGKNIKNELVMMPVRPDIILMPTFGTRAVMWQELTGKAKNTPGRILFPLFTTEDLDDMMAEVVAKFRWSLSKSMVGFIRQDTQTHNLFTDYYDYLQFYKKNRDLSTEAREKVKTQVDKYRNNVAEIFAADYQTWINYESKGLVRLNKVARSIMLKYCPFSAEIRNELIRHPLYSKEITSFNANLARQAKITEARYARLRKPNVPLDRELEEHLADLNM
ncbi:MAG: hypothetical protein GXY34_14505 [Syntrophomonadaceae bacterium]|nr:hypothetical protein [Syntrophomonadaceae bacterium]